MSAPFGCIQWTNDRVCIGALIICSVPRTVTQRQSHDRSNEESWIRRFAYVQQWQALRSIARTPRTAESGRGLRGWRSSRRRGIPDRGRVSAEDRPRVEDPILESKDSEDVQKLPLRLSPVVWRKATQGHSRGRAKLPGTAGRWRR